MRIEGLVRAGFFERLDRLEAEIARFGAKAGLPAGGPSGNREETARLVSHLLDLEALVASLLRAADAQFTVRRLRGTGRGSPTNPYEAKGRRPKPGQPSTL